MAFKILILLTFLVLSVQSNLKADEANALKRFKNSITDDPTGALQDWHPESTHHCNWTGIQCHNITKRVISISIPQAHLKGQISPFLGNLSSLKFLNLSFNSFTGNIPLQLGYCAQLSTLDLYNNSLFGLIPSELGRLKNLQTLDLGNNSITGSIPDSLCNCTSLLQLSVDSNKLNGTIPDRIGDFPNLRELWADNNLLEGSIPPSIGNLKELQGLDLNQNQLSGIIPREIGNLSRLQILSLWQNSLSGPIPTSIGNLKELQGLDLNHNQLSDIIPREIGNLSMLHFLYLSQNFLSGPIPISFGNLKELQGLDLNQNQLSGIIPREIGNLSRLQILYLHQNSLSGPIPTTIGNLKELQDLELHKNQLSGIIPREIGNLSSLQILYLHQNSLSGPIPTTIGNLKELQDLQLAQNQLSGIISREIGNLSSLQTLYLNQNSLSGPIPTSIRNLKEVLNLGLNINQFSGTIPSEILNLSSLQLLSVGNNNLEGRVPDKIYDLKQLTYLYLENNKFEGPILNSVSKLQMLSELDLSGNRFNESIGDTLTKLNRLMWIDLSHNLLTGSISGPMIASMKDIQMYLNFSNNFLTGNIPSEFGMMEMVQTIDISNNNLSGGIPVTIQNCRNLQSLDLSGNRLSGTISDEIFITLKLLSFINFSRNQLEGEVPKSIANLTSLTSLDLSQNKFSGPIPENFANSLALKHLNLSFNHLEGRVPDKGLFKNSSAVGLLGNPSLCVANGTKSCTYHSHQISRKVIILAILLGSLALLLVLFLVGLYYCYVRKPKVISGDKELEFTRGCTLERFERKELEDATNGFGENNILGTSSLSTVYKGRLTDGRLIAVKNLNFRDFSTKSDKSFYKEMSTLAKLRHRNLVKVVAYAWESRKLKALVLEYMGNGNLDKIIHDSGIDRSRWNLLERVNLLVSVSRGLVYLHSGYDFPIVHCDLKPSNILLDEKWDAHVSDFGTARILGVHHQDGGNVSSTSTFQGTIGYLAPVCVYAKSGTIPENLQFSGNRLSGTVSDAIFPTLGVLSYLNFSRNQLEGEIPVSLANLTLLTSIDLSHNKFSGTIPENFGNNLALKHINLSFNNLEGRVAANGLFKNASAVGLIGNPSLCVANGTKSCAYHSHQISRKVIILAILLGSLALLLVLFLPVLYYCYVRKPKVKSGDKELEFTRGCTLERFDRKELEDATNGFGESSILGTGSLSTVYEGRLTDGRMIAVKNLNFRDFSTESDKSFYKEMSTLAKLSNASAFQGTIGYLAPEFAYMRKVTTKVDVFSFGVIIMEFMTGKRPTGLTEDEGTLPQLIEHVLSNVICELVEIVDPVLASDFRTKHDVIKQILQLALSCTQADPEDRPDMNEILSSLTKISRKLQL